MYAGDNKFYLPRQGGGLTAAGFPRGVLGNWESDTTTGNGKVDGTLDMLDLLTTYFKLNLKLVSGTGADNWQPTTGWYYVTDSSSAVSSTGGWYDGLRYSPPKATICPASSNSDHYRSSYGYYSGGTSNWPLKITQLPALARVVSFDGSVIPGGSPALWGDRVCLQYLPNGSLASYPTGSNTGETNGHWNSTTKLPAGGNVGHADGSVVWCAYQPNGAASKPMAQTFVEGGAFDPSCGVCYPCDAIIPCPNNQGVLDFTGTTVNMIVGNAWQHASCYPH
jgi:hypothetical protein